MAVVGVVAVVVAPAVVAVVVEPAVGVVVAVVEVVAADVGRLKKDKVGL